MVRFFGPPWMFCCIVLYSVGYHWETTSVIILCRADVLQKASVSTIRSVRMEQRVRKTSRITRTLATVHLLLPADIVSLVSRHYINTVTFGQLWAVSTGFLIKWSIDWLNGWLIESENCEIRLLTELKPLSRLPKIAVGDYVGEATRYAKFDAVSSTWVEASGERHTFQLSFLYVYRYTFFSSNSLQVRTLDG